MHPNIPIITLTTDFGTSDEFVGVMKGVMLSVNPGVRIVDITHRIAAQQVTAAALMVPSYFRYFPQDTIHVVVVDPGVGGDRAVVAMRGGGHFFLGPDNGVFTCLLDEWVPEKIVRVENSRYFRSTVSYTFHGRDIFAPVAAHMASGVCLDDLGPEITVDRMVRVDLPGPGITGDTELRGMIVSADRFGNLITNIDRDLFEAFSRGRDRGTLRVHVAGKIIDRFVRSYRDAPPDTPIVLFGSRDRLEISVNLGSARDYLGAEPGETVLIRREGSCIGADGKTG